MLTELFGPDSVALNLSGTTRDEVLSGLGSPSVQSSFGTETWYYVASRKEATAFLKPEVTEQQVTRIEFDAAGVVSKIENFDESNSQDLNYAKRVTPTEGHQLGFFEQIMGNIVEPRWQGRRLSISPLVVLVTLLVWGWIWGVVGTLIAVPITVGSLLLAPRIFDVMYGSRFEEAVIAYQLLVPIIPLRMLGNSLGTALTAAPSLILRAARPTEP